MRGAARTFQVLLLTLATASCGRGSGEAAQPEAARSAPRDEVLYGATPVDNLRVTPVEIDAPDLAAALDGTRLVVLSDFQLGLWSGNVAVAQAAARRAAELQADAVVLLGDFMYRGDEAVLQQVLAPLRGRPVFAVLGDRDVRTDSVQAQVTRALQAAGVRVLVNDRAALLRNGDSLLIAGLDPDLIGRSVADQEFIITRLASRNAVLLSHFPGLATRVRENRFAAVLAGNTVCGDVEVPGAARLSFVEQSLLPGAVVPDVPQLFPIGRTTLFVACGVGYGFVPARSGGTPEIALVTLRRVGPPLREQPRTRDAQLDTLMQQYNVGEPATAAEPDAEP
jgi:uncharacterized protein